ncbi:MAG: hypothetical protein H0U50_13140 [Pyrinomonadaceae bacterium]|nr:hypothetical protein [Pyrinomonadaceae bacterium]
MKKQNVLLMIQLLAITFAFSACQKSRTENTQAQPQPIVAPTTDEDLLIRKIDFKNFTYTDKTGKNIFTLTNGEEPFDQMKDIAFSLENIEYADLTNDKEDEAIIHISVQYGGGSSGLFYVFTLENKNPKILWYGESGYGAEGELKKVYAENDKLIVEFFGNNQFVETTGEFKFLNQKTVPKDLCCPTSFTKFRFKWDGEKFALAGKPELLDYDWKKDQNKQWLPTR